MTRAVRDDAKAIEAIERRGILLVYPIANQDEPRSLWSELHPRTRMTWAWDASADARVARMWHLRERLATSLSVAYTKWFRGRATFIALEVFRAMLSRLASEGELTAGLSRDATTLLELLEDDSPQSTKVLRANAQLQGRRNETIYARALKELWSRLLIVGVGEVADGAFPSLQMSATRLRFEPLWFSPTRRSSRASSTRHAGSFVVSSQACPLQTATVVAWLQAPREFGDSKSAARPQPKKHEEDENDLHSNRRPCRHAHGPGNGRSRSVGLRSSG
jgi:hypothetical protein